MQLALFLTYNFNDLGHGAAAYLLRRSRGGTCTERKCSALAYSINCNSLNVSRPSYLLATSSMNRASGNSSRRGSFSPTQRMVALHAPHDAAFRVAFSRSSVQ